MGLVSIHNMIGMLSAKSSAPAFVKSLDKITATSQ